MAATVLEAATDAANHGPTLNAYEYGEKRRCTVTAERMVEPDSDSETVEDEVSWSGGSGAVADGFGDDITVEGADVGEAVDGFGDDITVEGADVGEAVDGFGDGAEMDGLEGEPEAGDVELTVADLPHMNDELVEILHRRGIRTVADVAVMEHGDLVEMTGLRTLPAVETLKAARAHARTSPERVKREQKRKEESTSGRLQKAMSEQISRHGKRQLRNLWRRHRPF